MKNEQIEHAFYKKLQKEIDRIDKKSDSYRNYYYTLRVSLIVLAGVITVASGWQSVQSKECVLNLILILGAITTALTAIDSLFQTETKKNTYRLMLVELREVRSEFVYYFEHQEKELENRIKTHLFPKYQTIITYSKSLIEKDNDSEAGAEKKHNIGV